MGTPIAPSCGSPPGNPPIQRDCGDNLGRGPLRISPNSAAILLTRYWASLPTEVGYSYVTTLEQSVVLLALVLLSLALVGTLAFLAVFLLSMFLVPVLLLVLSAEAGIWLVRRGLALETGPVAYNNCPYPY